MAAPLGDLKTKLALDSTQLALTDILKQSSGVPRPALAMQEAVRSSALPDNFSHLS